jgi:hypothetical protein
MKITLLSEPGMPTRGLSRNLSTVLAGQPNVEVDVVDAAAILANGIRGEVFCNAHGEIYPHAIEEALFAFFQAGGGLLHLGGVPFETAMRQDNGKWTEVVRTFGEMRRSQAHGPVNSPVDFFRAKLGLMAYAPAYAAAQGQQQFDAALVGAPSTPVAAERGIVVTTTISLHTARPDMPFGEDWRVYHVKPVVRDSHTAGLVIDPAGQTIMNTLTLTKAWGNPYLAEQSVPLRPWAIYTGISERLPPGLLDAMLRWLALPACLGSIDLPMPTLHKGETVSVHAPLHGELPTGWRVEGARAVYPFEAMVAEAPIAWQACPITAKDGQWTLEVSDHAAAYLFPVRFSLIDDQGRVRDCTESALVRWAPETLAEAPTLKANGRYFDIQQNGKTSVSTYLHGTNWQDRVQNAFHWHNPNPLRDARDAKVMADGGMRIARGHYFMPQWIKHSGMAWFGKDFASLYDHFEDGPELSERQLRALEAHAMVFGRLGIVSCPTLYTNVGPNMGNVGTWMWTIRLALPGHLQLHQRFGQQIMARLGSIPSISWDLCNEANTEMSRAGEWLQALKPIWGATGQTVGIGTFDPEQNMLLGEGADWHSIHCPCCKVGDVFHTGKPCLFQEGWVPTPATGVGEEDLELYLNRAIAWTVQFGAAGFMPWNWNMFLANWRYGSSFVELWDNELGCAVHADNTIRRGMVTMRNWSRLLDGIAFEQQADRQVAIVYPKTCLGGPGMGAYTDLLWNHKVRFCAINDSDVAEADLSQTALVILPYLAKGYRQATWKRLRDYAAKGGIVWAHTDVMQLDEDGNLAEDRQLTTYDGKEPLGAGYFLWALGYDGADKSLRPLKELVLSLPLAKRSEEMLALMDGELRFTQRWSTDEQTMKSDWSPLEKLPDRNVVTRVEMVDTQGNLRRGWSGEGAPFHVNGYAISAEGPLFLLADNGPLRVAAAAIRIADGAEPNAKLCDWRLDGWHTLDTPLIWQREGGFYVLRLAGWQRRYWVELGSACTP